MVEQDIAKGLAIILVMMLHILTTKTELFNIMGGIVGFIMSLFFFLTGYNYKSGKTFKENVVKRVKQILIPFFIYTSNTSKKNVSKRSFYLFKLSIYFFMALYVSWLK